MVLELRIDLDNVTPQEVNKALTILRSLCGEETQPTAAEVFAGNVVAEAAPVVVTPHLPAIPAPSAPIAAAPASLPIPPAPAAPAFAPPAPNGLDVDAAGLPWDARIHSSGDGGTKPKNADGKWRKKRGLNDGTFVAQVEAELRATMGVPPPPAPPAQPDLPLPPAVGDAGPTTFAAIMPRVTTAIMSGALPQSALVQAVAAYGLANIPALAHREDLVPAVWTYLKAQYPALV